MSSRKVTSYFCYGISFIIYLAILLWGISIRGDSAMRFGFALLNFYLILPITSFICSVALQLFKAMLKWVYPFVFALFGVAIAIIVLSIRHYEVWTLLIVPPFLGAVIGFVIRKIRDKARKK